MKIALVFSILVLANCRVHKSQVLSVFPLETFHGAVGYRVDSLIFVFKAEEYLNLTEFDSVPKIKGDSVDLHQYYQLIANFNSAMNRKYTEIREVYYLGSVLFPNQIILMKLFDESRITVYKDTEEGYEVVTYKCKRKNGIFTVTDLVSKGTIFIIGYRLRSY